MKKSDDKSGGGFSRRRFLASTSTLGAVAALGLSRRVAAEPPPETTKIRLVNAPAICFGPQFLAEELLRMEGFTDIQYVPMDPFTDPVKVLVAGKADFTQESAPTLLPLMDAGHSIVALSGIHTGCFELFANERITTIRDLKGKRVAIGGFGAADHLFISSMLAYVGVNPRTDINWIPAGIFKGKGLYVEGKADAVLTFPPEPQELRAKKVGRVIVNTAQDKPWSQDFCCMLTGQREFVQSHPVATKRVLRAFLKAADICAQDPERAARYMADKKYEPRYDMGLEVMKQLPYGRWREANPEDTMRFHGLRLYEVGMIRSTPQKLIAQNTDWRFLNELKKELKA